MGDVAPPPPDPVSQLAAQVNRFAGPSVPQAYRFMDQPIQVATGNLSADLALHAVLIYQRRATDAYTQFHDTGSEQAINLANQGLADPVAFTSTRIANLTTVIGTFADSLGLPPAAQPGSDGSGGGDDNLTQFLVIAGVGLALWWMLR